jgi:hypothetical protein
MSSLPLSDSWVRRHPFCGGRVRSPQATAPDPQSLPAAGTESTRHRSPGGRLVRSPHEPCPPHPFCHRTETLDPIEPPPSPGKRKYRLLFSAKRRRQPGPKGPRKELIDAIVAAKQRNISWGSVRRVLAIHCRPKPDPGGPSWLTLLGHLRDSPWRIDLFCSESVTMRTHWILVVMNQCTCRSIGFGV